MDLTLNNLQWLTCQETKPNQIKKDYYFLLFETIEVSVN